MIEKEMHVDVNCANDICLLKSQILPDFDDGLLLDCLINNKSVLFTINKATAKKMIEIIVMHYKKRHSLTDDESDAIARLI